MGLCWIWYIKRQCCRFRMSGNFSILHPLYTQLRYTVMTLFKGYFPESTILKPLECCYCFIVFLAHNCVPYCKWDSNSEWYAVFSILKFTLIWSLLSIPIAWLSLIFICTICLFQSRCSSIKTPRYLTEWV